MLYIWDSIFYKKKNNTLLIYIILLSYSLIDVFSSNELVIGHWRYLGCSAATSGEAEGAQHHQRVSV